MTYIQPVHVQTTHHVSPVAVIFLISLLLFHILFHRKRFVDQLYRLLLYSVPCVRMKIKLASIDILVVCTDVIHGDIGFEFLHMYMYKYM